jgi:hypothetical protein
MLTRRKSREISTSLTEPSGLKEHHMTHLDVATRAMIEAATNMIQIGFSSRGAIADALHAAYGANIAQATDAIRAARHALPFNTSYLRA